MKDTFSDTPDGDRGYYAKLVNYARDAATNDQHDRVLTYATVAASLAWSNVFRWYDDELEAILESVGADLISDHQLPKDAHPTEEEDVRIAYIATTLADHGGHTETLRLWTRFLDEYDDIAQKHVVLTNARNNGYTNCPDLKECLGERGISIDQLDPSTTHASRVRMLAELIRNLDPDRIVLFTDPSDAVAFAAIAGLESPPRVIFYNHADHVFWLGRRIVDDLVEYRPVGREISKVHRNLKSEMLVPLTTDILPIDDVEPYTLGGRGTVSVSIGSAYKFQPRLGYDYLETVERILERCPDHQHILITDNPDSVAVDSKLSPDVSERFIVDGPYPDLRPIYRAADLVLDTFPFSGGMVRLEAAAIGLPFVGFELREFPFLTSAGVVPDTYEYTAKTEDEYVEMVLNLVRNEEARSDASALLREMFREHHTTDDVGERLYDVVIGDKREDWDDVPLLTFDEEAYASFMRSSRKVNYELLLQTLSRKSSLGLRSRIQLYLDALRGGEFDSPAYGAYYLISASVGTQIPFTL